MTLYIPKLAAGARPPVGFPPQWFLRRDIFALAALLLHAGWVFLLLATEAPSYGITTATLGVWGFWYVSGLVLGRQNWFHSRYGTPGQLLLGVGIMEGCALLAGSGAWMTSGAMPSLTVICAYHASFFVGLHLVFADGSSFFQTFGCKWSDVRRWSSCTSADVFLAVVILSLGSIGIIGQSAVLIAHPDAAQRAGLVTIIIASCCGIFAVALHATHDLHFHHYFAVLLVLPAASAGAPFSFVSVCLEGLLFGVFIEGVATWGIDPLLVPRELPATARTDYPTAVWVSVGSALQHEQSYLLSAYTLLKIMWTLETSEGGISDLSSAATGVTVTSLRAAFRFKCELGLHRLCPEWHSLPDVLDNLAKAAVSCAQSEASRHANTAIVAAVDAVCRQLVSLLAASGIPQDAAHLEAAQHRRIVAFFAGMTTVHMACVAGSVELSQSLALAVSVRQEAAHRACASVPSAAVLQADSLCRALFGFAASCGSRSDFDAKHTRLRQRRDDWEGVLLRQGCCCLANNASGLLLRQLQDDIISVVDAASLAGSRAVVPPRVAALASHGATSGAQ